MHAPQRRCMKPGPLSCCAMRRESRGSGGRLSGCRRRIQSADARTIGAGPPIGYGTTGERAIRETQIIGSRGVGSVGGKAPGAGLRASTWRSPACYGGIPHRHREFPRIACAGSGATPFASFPILQHAVDSFHVWRIEFLKTHTCFNRTKETNCALALHRTIVETASIPFRHKIFKKPTDRHKCKILFLKDKLHNPKIKIHFPSQKNLLISAARFSGFPRLPIPIFNFI